MFKQVPLILPQASQSHIEPSKSTAQAPLIIIDDTVNATSQTEFEYEAVRFALIFAIYLSYLWPKLKSFFSGTIQLKSTLIESTSHLAMLTQSLKFPIQDNNRSTEC